MTRKQFEDKLRSKSHEDLLSLLLSLYDSNSTIRTLLSNALTMAGKTGKVGKTATRVAHQHLTEKYISKLERIFEAREPSILKADQLLAEFIISAPSDADIALLRLHYADCCVNELALYGGGPKEFYKAADSNFKFAVDYARSDRAFLDKNLDFFKSVAEGFPETEYFAEWLDEILNPKKYASILTVISGTIRNFEIEDAYTKGDLATVKKTLKEFDVYPPRAFIIEEDVEVAGKIIAKLKGIVGRSNKLPNLIKKIGEAYDLDPDAIEAEEPGEPTLMSDREKRRRERLQQRTKKGK